MQNCQYCGNKEHENKSEYPAYKKQCRTCPKYNHFAKLCKSVTSVHEVTSEQMDYWKVRFALQDKLKAELELLEAKHVICKVTQPSSYINS